MLQFQTISNLISMYNALPLVVKAMPTPIQVEKHPEFGPATFLPVEGGVDMPYRGPEVDVEIHLPGVFSEAPFRGDLREWIKELKRDTSAKDLPLLDPPVWTEVDDYQWESWGEVSGLAAALKSGAACADKEKRRYWEADEGHLGQVRVRRTQERWKWLPVIGTWPH